MKTQSLRTESSYARRLPRPQCPHCHDLLFAPAVSVHVSERDVRHWWSCDNCGHEFMTSVKVAATPEGLRFPALS